MSEMVLANEARERAVAILADRAVVAARASASAMVGLVIASDEDAQALADNLKQLSVGEKKVAAMQAEACAPFKAAVFEVQSILSPIKLELSRGVDAGKAAARGWVETQRRRADAIEIQRRLAAEKAAADAAAETEVTGEPAPPPMEVVRQEPPRMTRGAAGSFHTFRTLTAELVNHLEAEPEWLTLKSAAALEAFRASNGAAGEGTDTGDGIVWKGVRFAYRESVAVR